jgi:hypothetical protein
MAAIGSTTYGDRDGWWWIVGCVYYLYPAPVYPYPDPYVPPTVVPAPTYWFYCQNPPRAITLMCRAAPCPGNRCRRNNGDAATNGTITRNSARAVLRLGTIEARGGRSR